MSGPKGYNVQLSAEVRRAQAEAAVRARCVALLDRRQALQRQLAVLGAPAQLAEHPTLDRASLATLEQAERALAGEVQSLTAQERTVRADIVRRNLEQRLEAAPVEDIHVPTPAAAPPGAHVERHTTEDLRRSLNRVLDVVAQLDDQTSGSLLTTVEQINRLLAQGDASGADLMLLRLQTDVERARHTERERQHVLAAAFELAVRAADLTGPEGDALRSRALTCSTPEELDAVRAEEQALRARWMAERDRSYIIEQTRQALRELGYEVGGDFDVTARAGVVVVNRPDLPDHGVELTFATRAPRVLTRVVAYTQTSPQRDKEVEETTCADLAHLQQAWRDHGVDAVLYHHASPGAEPVARRTKAGSASQRTTTATTTARERHLP